MLAPSRRRPALELIARVGGAAVTVLVLSAVN